MSVSEMKMGRWKKWLSVQLHK